MSCDGYCPVCGEPFNVRDFGTVDGCEHMTLSDADVDVYLRVYRDHIEAHPFGRDATRIRKLLAPPVTGTPDDRA